MLINIHVNTVCNGYNRFNKSHLSLSPEGGSPETSGLPTEDRVTYPRSSSEVSVIPEPLESASFLFDIYLRHVLKKWIHFNLEKCCVNEKRTAEL